MATNPFKRLFGKSRQQNQNISSGSSQLIDPVCGMTVDSGSPFRAQYQGQSYVFCSEDCKRQFDSDPAGILARSRQRPAA